MEWWIWITWWIIFCIRYARLFLVSHQKVWNCADDPPIRIYVNKIANRITFEIKTGYHLKLLITKTIKLLGRAKNNITNDKNGENVLHLEINDVVLVQCNTVNYDYEHDSRVLYKFVLHKSFGQLFANSPKNFIFLKCILIFSRVFIYWSMVY